jgi:hypothetical protein
VTQRKTLKGKPFTQLAPNPPLYRATEPAESALHQWSCWSEDEQTAEAYTEEGVGHGGSHVRSIDVDFGRMLDIAEGPGAPPATRGSFERLAEGLGYDDPERTAQAWLDNIWLYPWEESRDVRERLEQSGYEWLRYDDDYPEGAVTVMRIPRTLRQNPRGIEFDSFETREVLAGVYRGRRQSELTHLVYLRERVDVATGCRQPLGHLADRYSLDPGAEHARPTCPTCARKWDRLTERRQL